VGYGQVAAAVLVGEGFGILRETRLAYHIIVMWHIMNIVHILYY